MNWLVLAMAWVVAMPLWAADLESDLADIQRRWAEIQYQLPEKQQAKAFEDLSAEVEEFVGRYPNRAEPLIWEGIVLSTYAGVTGGIGALGMVKDARESLEAALAIDADALDGSAYTSLGSLYYQVPGWPLAFGDDDKARHYLEKSLAINPDSIDANYFFGDFLLEQGEPERAQIYLRKVLQVPGRPSRDVADAGRREEAEKRLQEL